ncbi:CLUMA_CG003469, isoform A, partial [Clunio marinus]
MFLFDDTSDRTLLNDQLNSSCFDSCPSSPSSSAESVSSMKSRKSSNGGTNKKNAKKKKENSIEDLIVQQDEVENVEDEVKCLFNKSVDLPSPTHSMMSSASHFSWQRERELENTNENLQEKLKDTEERFNSLRIQYDSLSQVHRVLRENHVQLQEETEKLKIDFQILNECANVLRCELQTAKQDRESANEVSKILQQEIDENRVNKKKFQDIADRDAKTIQDLQRQCREMERILMRKHPDSVSALIVASKNSNASSPDASTAARKLLEERIAQLEADAKEQDKKAQGILANVQARFKTVQAKYETHIQDLETQVLSLQQINMEQSKELYAKSSTVANSTQTLDVPEKETVEMRTIGSQTKSSSSSSNPPSRSGSSQSISGTKKSTNKIPNSQSDSSIQPKEDAHLMATIRGMRVELAIKEKAVQRLTRDLDECKKTIRKLQKERDNYLLKEKPTTASGSLSTSTSTATALTTSKKVYDPKHYQENSDSQALKAALEKIKVMETDFKALYEKRVKDLKTLQNAHEREINSSHETIKILQNRLEEKVAQVGNVKEKRRGPVDYFALKAKVTSLERRHSDREKSLHLLIDALSKGKVSSLSPDESSSPHSCTSPVNKNFSSESFAVEMKILLVAFVFCLPFVIESVPARLECEYVINDNFYECRGKTATKENDYAIDTLNGNHVSNKKNEDVTVVALRDTTMEVIPSNLRRWFPNFTGLGIVNIKNFVTLDRCQLHEYPQLKEFFAYNIPQVKTIPKRTFWDLIYLTELVLDGFTNLENLDGDLLVNNTALNLFSARGPNKITQINPGFFRNQRETLMFVNFEYTNIVRISHQVFEGLNKLNMVSFLGGGCINQIYNQEIATRLTGDIKTKCQDVTVQGNLILRNKKQDETSGSSEKVIEEVLKAIKMGNKIITFTHDQLDHYQDCTFFNKKEILKVFKKFRNLSPELIPLDMTSPESSKVRMPKERIIKLSELLENPFKERICESFSKDGYGNLNFEEFLDCLSVFSEHAPRDLKIFYAFKIYDYDSDGFISEADIRQVLKNLTKGELTFDEQQKITEKIIEEGDIDN